jgi:hypothetical protein
VPRRENNSFFEVVSMLMGLIKSLTSRIGEEPGVYLASSEQEKEHEQEFN